RCAPGIQSRAGWTSTSRRSPSATDRGLASVPSAGWSHCGREQARAAEGPMSPLVRIRAGRDQMSAIDRRVADFVLENAHLLRDYSSPQLADALGISQSSVVKFSQKL